MCKQLSNLDQIKCMLANLLRCEHGKSIGCECDGTYDCDNYADGQDVCNYHQSKRRTDYVTD